MKYNTMKQYLGGGYMRPMGYQTGGYIPGISRLRYGIGLNTKVDQAQEDFRKQAEKVEKEQGKRALFGKVGGFLGTAAAGLLAPATGGASLALLPILAKGAGSAIGSGIGEAIAGKVYDAGDITKSSTGLFDKDFTELKGIEEEGEKLGSGKGLLKGEGLIGRALGRGAGTAASALGGEIMRVGKLKAGARLAGKSGAGSLNLDVINPEGATPQLFGGKGLTPSSQGFQAPSIDTSSFTPSNIESTFAQDQLDPMSILEQAGYPTQTPDLARQYYMEDRLGYGVGNQGLNFAGMMEGGMMRNYAEGGQLKQAPEGNKGLMKLPKEVRNRMGYMQEGGEVLSKVLRGVGSNLDRGSIDQDGDMINFKRVLSIPAEQVGGGEGLRYYAGEGMSDRLQMSRNKAYMDAVQKMVSAEQDSIPMSMIDEYLAPKKRSLRDFLPFQKGGSVEEGMMDDYMGGGMMDNYMYGGMAKKKKEYAGGGLLGMMPFKRRIV